MHFEILYTTTDYYDGPRRGVTDFNGKPHFYESCWADIDGEDDVFLLTPIFPGTLALALEAWAIWLRWSAAFRAGLTTLETHPALPEDRTRHAELDRLLKSLLTTDMSVAISAKARFDYSQCDQTGKRLDRVAWTVVPFDSALDKRAEFHVND